MVQSANITQTVVSGKYGRVLISTDGSTLYPVNLDKWSMRLSTERRKIRGFEALGWGEGVTMFLDGALELTGPYQLIRAGGVPAPGMQILVPGRYFFYYLYVTHPDFNAAQGSVNRYAGVAQVTDTPHDHEALGVSMISISAESQGPIWLPGVALNFTPTQLLTYYASGILSSDIPIANVLLA